MFVKMYRKMKSPAPRERVRVPTKPCDRCNEFGGHFDGHDFQECSACFGEGRVEA